MPDAPITYGILQPGPSVEKGVLYVRPTEIKDGVIDINALRRTTPEIAGRYAKSRLCTGDLLITIVGTIGNIATVPPELDGANITQSSARIRPNAEVVCSGYLFHYLRSTAAIRQYDDNRLGATVPRLNLHHVRDLQIPLPPLPVQKRIAAILDAADALRAKRRESIEQLDSLIQATFLEMFGDPVTNPKGWECGHIGDLMASVNYGTSKKAHSTDGAFPILRMGNITYEGGWDFSDLKFIDLDGKERDKYLVHRGDILFNRTNSRELVGKTAVYRSDTPMAFAGYLVRAVTNERASPEYVGAFMNSRQIKASLRNMCKAIVGMANINASEFRAIGIPIPPLDLQTRFASIVESIEQQKARLKAHLDELDTLFASLQSRAFNGELVA
jgi:type I restriction enzyme S subunit